MLGKGWWPSLRLIANMSTFSAAYCVKRTAQGYAVRFTQYAALYRSLCPTGRLVFDHVHGRIFRNAVAQQILDDDTQ